MIPEIQKATINISSKRNFCIPKCNLGIAIVARNDAKRIHRRILCVVEGEKPMRTRLVSRPIAFTRQIWISRKFARTLDTYEYLYCLLIFNELSKHRCEELRCVSVDRIPSYIAKVWRQKMLGHKRKAEQQVQIALMT